MVRGVDFAPLACALHAVSRLSTNAKRAPSFPRHALLVYKRFGESHELIGACVFLAAHKASSFVTGIELVVDGGFLAQTI